jgi:sensor histidine kinase YesM
MENSEYDFIPLQKELEILELYLTLEHFRFKDQFEYSIEVNNEVDEEDYNIPPMLVQPYIENAVWHGLRYKTDSGILKLGITKENENLLVSISDNGIGRQKSAELKTANQKKNKSTALRNIKQRIEIVNELNNMNIHVSIRDLNEDGTGTVVQLIVPQQKLKG